MSQLLGLGLASVSLLAVITLTIRDHRLAGWPATVVAAVAWLIAPALLYGRLRGLDLDGPAFGLVVLCLNAAVIAASRGRPILLMNQLFDSEDQRLTPALARRGRRAQGTYIALVLVGTVILTLTPGW